MLVLSPAAMEDRFDPGDVMHQSLPMEVTSAKDPTRNSRTVKKIIAQVSIKYVFDIN